MAKLTEEQCVAFRNVFHNAKVQDKLIASRVKGTKFPYDIDYEVVLTIEDVEYCSYENPSPVFSGENNP